MSEEKDNHTESDWFAGSKFFRHLEQIWEADLKNSLDLTETDDFGLINKFLTQKLTILDTFDQRISPLYTKSNENDINKIKGKINELVKDQFAWQIALTREQTAQLYKLCKEYSAKLWSCAHDHRLIVPKMRKELEDDERW